MARNQKLFRRGKIPANSKLKVFNANIPIVHTLLCEKFPSKMAFIRDYINKSDNLRTVYVNSKMIIFTYEEPNKNLRIVFPINEKLHSFLTKHYCFNALTISDGMTDYHYNQITLNSIKKGTLFQKIEENCTSLNTIISFAKKNMEIIRSIEHNLTFNNAIHQEGTVNINMRELRKE